jgi:hypothetical protein
MTTPDRAHALDHIVVLMFENRSFDNLLGYLYQPGEVLAFEGVASRSLSNPVPQDIEIGTFPAHFPPLGTGQGASNSESLSIETTLEV